MAPTSLSPNPLRSPSGLLRLQTSAPAARPHLRLPPPQRRWTTVSASSPRRRQVVSTFLCVSTPLDADFRVVFFRRSRQGHVYANKWGTAAGSIQAGDGSPLEAALREVREEAGLAFDPDRDGGKTPPPSRDDGGNAAAAVESQESLPPVVSRVLVRGRPHDMVDDKLETPTVWEIHSFLMQVDPGRRFDGSDGRSAASALLKSAGTGVPDQEPEFDDAVLIRPAHMRAYDMVDGLAETLARLRDDYFRRHGRHALVGQWVE